MMLMMWCLLTLASASEIVVGSLSVQVSHAEDALQSVRERVEADGGWFSELTTTHITARVPVDDVDAFIDWSSTLGRVTSRNLSRQDVSAQIADAEAKLQARKEVMDRYLALLDEADASSVVTVEREVVRLVREIEAVTGQLNKLRDRSSFAQITVAVRFMDRRAPRATGVSNFEWLNTLEARFFASGLAGGFRASPSRAVVVPPTDFAPFGKRRSRFLAVSPDSVAYRVRSARHRPTAELSFWREAVHERMVDAGYTIVERGELRSADGREGFWVELGAAVGESDQTYLIGVYLDGNRVIIAEALGESTRFAARRDAVLAAMNGISM